MSALLELVLSNLAMVVLLALAALAVQRWGRRPALAHGLWLLVLIKLITPPLVRLPILSPAASPVEEAQVPAVEPAPAPVAADLREAPPVIQGEPARQAPFQDEPPRFQEANLLRIQPLSAAPAQKDPAAAPPLAAVPVLPLAALVQPDGWVDPPSFAWSAYLPYLILGAWLIGALAWFWLAGRRLACFHQLLTLGRPAPDQVQKRARWLCRRMQVACPQVWLVPGQISPLLWTWRGAARLVLPLGLLERLSAEQWDTLLAHELAHWKRRDHWVRRLEFLVLGLYWWCPLAWWAKTGLQQAEEECCDAWVVWLLPGAERAYALALVETVDFLAGARASLPPATSGLGHVRLLQRRLTMILRGRTPRALTLGGLTALLVLGLIWLPLAPGRAQDPATGQKQDPDIKKKLPPPGLQDLKPADPKDILKDPKELKPIDPKDVKPLNPLFPPGLPEEARKIQEEMRKLQEDFQKKQRELMEKMMKALGKGGFPVPPIGIGDPTLPAPFPLPPPPVGFPPGGFPGGGGDVEKRLQDMERKLDRLMQEILELRGKKGPAVDPKAIPKDAPIPGPGNAPPRPGVNPPPVRPPVVADPATQRDVLPPPSR